MKKYYVIIFTIGVFSILNTEMGIVGILPAISGQYGVSIAAAGMLVSLFAFGIAVSGPILPMLLSRFDRKKVMISVLGLFTASNLIAAFAVNFPMLMAARIIPAFFHPVYVAFALAAASDSVEDASEAPKAVSKVMMGVSAGLMLGAPIAGVITDSLGLRASLLFFAVANLLPLIATILFVPGQPAQAKAAYGEQLRVLKEKKLWVAFIGSMLLNGSIFGVYSYASAYFNEGIGLSPQSTSMMLFAFGFMTIVGNMIAGRGLSSKSNRFISIQPAIICVTYLLMVVTAGRLAVPALAAVLVWGIFAGIVTNTIQYWVMTAAPGAPEFANGLYLTAANLGIFAATPFCGMFITKAGIQTAPLGGILLVLLSAVFIFLKICVMDKNYLHKKEAAK